MFSSVRVCRTGINREQKLDGHCTSVIESTYSAKTILDGTNVIFVSSLLNNLTILQEIVLSYIEQLPRYNLSVDLNKYAVFWPMLYMCVLYMLCPHKSGYIQLLLLTFTN